MQIQIVKRPQPIDAVVITLSEHEAIYLKYMMFNLRGSFVLNGDIDKLRFHLHEILDKELTP